MLLLVCLFCCWVLCVVVGLSVLLLTVYVVVDLSVLLLTSLCNCSVCLYCCWFLSVAIGLSMMILVCLYCYLFVYVV